MFTIRKDRKVWWPVLIQTPRDDGSGELDEHRFEIQITLLKRSDWKRFQELARGEDDAAGEDLLIRHIHNWREGPVDEHGNQVPFSSDVLRACLEEPFFVRAVSEAIIRASSGQAARGNSKAG